MNSTESATNGTQAEDFDYCTPQPFVILERVFLGVFCGITVSILSIVFNSFMFLVFASNKQHRKSPNLYMLLLSIFDIFIAIAYIAVMSTRIIVLWTYNYTLQGIWSTYMIPMLAVSHVGITSSTFLICIATVERYCITVNNFLVPHLQKYRPTLAFIAIMCGLISKGSWVKELRIRVDEECVNKLNHWRVEIAPWLFEHPTFNSYFRFYFRNIFTILAPFFILLFVNWLLLTKLRQQNRNRTNEDNEKQTVKQKKARIRAATRTLVIIVCTYLFSNSLSVVVTIWEYIDGQSLFSNEWAAFYTISVDIISLLTIVASAMRLPIYAICQPLLRIEMKVIIAKICGFGQSSEKKRSLLNSLQLPSTQLITNLDGDSPSISSKVEFV